MRLFIGLTSLNDTSEGGKDLIVNVDRINLIKLEGEGSMLSIGGGDGNGDDKMAFVKESPEDIMRAINRANQDLMDIRQLNDKKKGH